MSVYGPRSWKEGEEEKALTRQSFTFQDYRTFTDAFVSQMQ